MTEITRCPNCHARLPRQLHYISPSHGRESVFGVTAFVAGYGGVLFALWHMAWPQSLWPWLLARPAQNLVIGAALYGAWLAIVGMLVTTLWWLLERGRERPVEVEGAGEAGATIGGNLRAMDGRRQWLLERGFDVPPEPERGALARWLLAVHDERVTLSQRGARTAVRDNPAVRQWASDILALWCQAGWAEPVAGWNGDAPDLGQGVTAVDAGAVYAVAMGGYEALLERLAALADESVQSPAPNSPEVGGSGWGRRSPTGGGSAPAIGVGEYEFEPLEANDERDD